MDKEHHPVERFVFEISQPTLLSIRCGFVYFFYEGCLIKTYFENVYFSPLSGLWFCGEKLRHVAVAHGTAAQGLHPEDQCV